MLQGKKILVALTGSIAAYKTIILVRLLVKAGAEVRVVLTASAKDFVSPLTLATLSKNKVLSDLFEEGAWVNHVELGRWADLMVIAPLSCNTLAKMAIGLCDNLLLATYLSAKCPILVAPAMDEDMWQHQSTQTNIEKIVAYGVHVLPVEKGELASGLYGEGRIAEPESIFRSIQDNFFFMKDMEGSRVLITAGPTHESIDPVRFIGNHSSGKMGVAIAKELSKRGADVNLILGPSSLEVNLAGVHVQRVESADEMYKACLEKFPYSDIAVMSAAVADYKPLNQSKEKLKKHNSTLTLELTRTKDILQSLGKMKRKDQILVGFALENQNEREYALAKLTDKNADMIVLNSLNDDGAGFGYDTNKVVIFERGGQEFQYDRKPKQQVAKDIVDRIVKMQYAS
jgi:phosphopantothenoylcysteine decarboxylase / phosphopantothenate---cysteine ligase